ncbi:phospho-sugar mutase [Candidatus Poriferisodalis sp.]|uniref:phospho-sugar mutase n=1 Tax=Candidatus Poriferisodalis sp. TaxID=3101277 RepID=UPI003B5285AE
MTTPTTLLDAWLAADPDPVARSTIEANRERPDWVEAHFGSVLRFGTAGMRGPSGPGPARMNRVMARLSARAIGAELVSAGLADRGAVVGFDARSGSADMAFDAARLLAAMGIPTAIIDGPAPTPLLARQLLARSAGAGLMITASHNPRDDNGLKVYWADGTQIRPPLDRRIEARMDLGDLPTDDDLAVRHELELLDVRSVIAEYVGAAVRRPVFGPDGLPADPADVPEFVYTALCGVGSQTLGHAFATAGLPPPIYVEHQRHPDATFPGLPFPNPEEPGTLDDAIALASDEGIDLVLANDPDADRLAVAVRDGDGAWRRLSGDELGVLLCDWLIGLAGSHRAARPLISASSVVSGRMVEALCTARGVGHHRTLTGFKWIMEPRLAHPDAHWVFGYEEALGYSVTDAVLDKDGISAAIEFARLTGALAARGMGPLERLDELAAEFGLHVTAAASVRASAGAIAAAMAALRANPPRTIAGRSVTNIADWLDASTPHPADLVELELAPATADGSNHDPEAQVRICIRPSGTEPKAKIYLEAVIPSPGDIRAERHRLRALLDAIAAETRDSLFTIE